MAIRAGDAGKVATLVDSGGVHCNLCLQGSHLTAAQKSITPIQRAARHGHLEIVRILLSDVRPQAAGSVLNTQTAYQHTALHWAAVYGQATVVEELIVRGCSAAAVNHRNRTAWDVAEAH